MPIEFDPEKDARQAADRPPLARAAELDWRNAVIRPDLRRDYGERRWQAYAMLDNRLHMAAFTVRGDVIRIISLRRANRREVKRYGRSSEVQP